AANRLEHEHLSDNKAAHWRDGSKSQERPRLMSAYMDLALTPNDGANVAHPVSMLASNFPLVRTSSNRMRRFFITSFSRVTCIGRAFQIWRTVGRNWVTVLQTRKARPEKKRGLHGMAGSMRDWRWTFVSTILGPSNRHKPHVSAK